MFCTGVTILCLLGLSSTTFAKPVLASGQNGTMITDFSQVSLDYGNTDVGTTDIAFIKWTTNSTNSTTSSAKDVLVNPGGPGASGVQYLRSNIASLQATLGTENNLVGFDPRGVNNSGPDLSCFPGRVGTSRFYDEDLGSALDANSSQGISETFTRAAAFGDWCSRAHAADNDTAKYANTIATAQDMLHYTQLAAESRGEGSDDSKLYYYGASYGTVLGSTFAALYPDRIGRMVLDAVVDVEDYYRGAWSTNLYDADAAVESFFHYCYEAGNSSCAFWAETPKAIKNRFQAVFDDLEANPIPVTDPDIVSEPVIVTIADFKEVLGGVPYAPIAGFPILARVLAQLEQRNGALLAPQATGGLGREDQCAPSPRFEVDDLEPRHFIACTDADGRYNLSSLESFTEHIREQVELSKYMGEAWAAGTSVNCRSLNIRAPEHQVFEGVPSANSTSKPILFIGNTLDPVTPLRWAKKMSQRFPNSRVLTLDAVGHASSAALSTCIYGHTKQYMKDATLPPEGTICEPDKVPFERPGTNVLDVADISILRKRHYVKSTVMR